MPFGITYLILNGTRAWHWAAAGAAIGVITLLLLFIANKRLGISTSFENICALGSRIPYFNREEMQGPGRWRLIFLAGLLAGGFASALSTGGWRPFWDMGMFDMTFGWGPFGKTVWVFIGGLLIGLGTRIAGGCTSGHGIFGLSNFERASLVATLSFMIAGIIMTNIVYRGIFGL